MPAKRPMTLIMISSAAERIHMALMTGATAAAMGRPVTFFFSKSAVRFLTRAGWQAMQTSDGEPAPEMDAALEARGVADSAVLLDGIAALNVRFVACDSALREHDIDPGTLITRPHVEIGGLAEVIEKGEGGDWLTF
ncbi:DsrE family protein [Kordiimonas aestuarii]|uniref:DsrE family protein n=1 Tax=Kordiimonas aestuarii TaxID=1005925 RepID=UPI0021CE2BD1|nr:DsrE family protein [Kordiimonas aestuarii]